MRIIIPGELVPLVRDGLYFDLHGQLEKAAALIEPRGREGTGPAIEDGLVRAEGARALLDVVGWQEPAEACAVEVDVRWHREALLRALLTRIESECGVRGDQNASEEDRAQASARCDWLAELVARVEATRRTGSVTVPASFVDLLREALVSGLADCAGKIEDAGHSEPGGIDGRLLEPFDAYRALLERVGWVRVVPAVAVEVELSVHRWALVSALRQRLVCELYIAHEVDLRRARCRAGRIEAFLSTAGLEDDAEDSGASSAQGCTTRATRRPGQ